MSKINSENFLRFLKKKNINFFTGIPDSLLKDFNNLILSNVSSNNHIITANEGSAISLATGYYLSTNKIPLVYLQNSGTGNIINPLMSLVSKDVYSIPMLIIIGWRGEPGIKDEPQHISQGKCMIELIKSLGISYDILPSDEEIAFELLDKSIEFLKKECKPHIILVKKNTFEKFKNNIKIENNYTIYRKEAIKFLIEYFKDSIILSTTGKISRELLESADEIGLSHDNIFLNVGAMGHVSMISLGIALNTSKKVLCVDGDGSVIMHMGNLSNIGNSKCGNLIHVVLNNGMHESVGIQPTNAFNINLTEIAKNCGYSYCKCISSLDNINDILKEIVDKEFESPIFIEIRINNKVNYSHELSRPKNKPIVRKKQFMDFINKI